MARRRKRASWRWFLPLAAAVILAGLTAGLLLGRGPLARRTGPGSAPPPSPPRAAPLPLPPRPATITVDDAPLTAAVRRTLGGLGRIALDSEQPQSLQAGAVLLRWHSHILEVRTRRSPGEVARALETAVAGEGGQVLSRGGTVTIGVVRQGRRLTTHEVRVLRATSTARAAIIFDDAGGSVEDVEEIIALGRPVTIAVLPGLRFSRDVAARAREAGLEVFLHLPIEPEDPTKDLGPGGITVAMGDAEIAATVRGDLASVPGATGVNNHMGSKGTADGRVMRAVLGVVKERHLIWVDSVTSPRTLGGRLAAGLGIRTASRQVFLDNEDEPGAIRAQIRRLIEIARRKGEAVAIGHAHRRTAQVLRQMLGEFDTAGIELVPASALAR